MIQQQDGKGVSKGKSPAQMDAERRAKKARQNAVARAKSGNTSASTTLLEGLREDRQQAKREIELFQLRQAIEALNNPSVTKLYGLAKEIAEATIQAFPDARGDRSKNISKTRAAYELALRHFKPEELARESALNLGRCAAAQALSEAYRKVS